jgi:hypothetical protein
VATHDPGARSGASSRPVSSLWRLDGSAPRQVRRFLWLLGISRMQAYEESKVNRGLDPWQCLGCLLVIGSAIFTIWLISFVLSVIVH